MDKKKQKIDFSKFIFDSLNSKDPKVSLFSVDGIVFNRFIGFEIL